MTFRFPLGHGGGLSNVTGIAALHPPIQGAYLGGWVGLLNSNPQCDPKFGVRKDVRQRCPSKYH
ncbi:hypothetical protein XBP1_330071 [Xenorhabdus bovienii str. puntauvense]|uniref:Uncharacterized protein n=1 Tax=Xenorhabdus bovienii str. puntauvense TaxID=1398201 RepID=A0A077NJB2_XENBV|nr:hypothetical protein XBFFR1_2050110 [Xenorhabdus bovienii str. feltiae France]CDG92360.1 hypothetical protein XBFFL1_2170002 [Xenorhabdus bovienii str. feltiae Florida]CDG98563.1 hypothetical protein XBP1_330071 [Xenorhabdus bovienii str. puntauvense]